MPFENSPQTPVSEMLLLLQGWLDGTRVTVYTVWYGLTERPEDLFQPLLSLRKPFLLFLVYPLVDVTD